MKVDLMIEKNVNILLHLLVLVFFMFSFSKEYKKNVLVKKLFIASK